jgi:hypothetical protein
VACSREKFTNRERVQEFYSYQCRYSFDEFFAIFHTSYDVICIYCAKESNDVTSVRYRYHTAQNCPCAFYIREHRKNLHFKSQVITIPFHIPFLSLSCTPRQEHINFEIRSSHSDVVEDAFRDVTPCSLAYGYHSLEGVYCLQVNGQAAHRFMGYLPCKQGHYAPPKRW